MSAAGGSESEDGVVNDRTDETQGTGEARDDRPPLLAVVVGLLAGLVAFLATFLAAPIGGALVGLGVLVLWIGAMFAAPRLLTWAAALGVAGLALAGYLGAAPEPLLVAAVALALAWDSTDHGLSLGEHVGRDGGASRSVLVHAGTNLLVGIGSVAVVYGTYAVAAGGQPVAALTLLLFGAVVLISFFR
ncbi:DUF7519 family protein [Halorubrum vacuolatum]|uniref:Uncharacterized protein n=1 Tax=Halorubrum vacuolatum TaxID=63740 RepID=A0A238W0T0_HALVU|nr:hypothetical protein [Halorubrum vacuolatum]SNR40116.1 hypothetical protein SAMN06264855_10511 [Halorubrum vacuolatum]